MKEQLISFETAKLAKKKGFSHKVSYFFYKDGSKGYMSDIGEFVPNCEADWNNTYEEIHKDKCSAPTQSLLQKWLREEHNLHVELSIFNDSVYRVSIWQINVTKYNRMDE